MKSVVYELNLELGYPTVDEALRRLENFVGVSRKMKRPVLKIIHGYGSSGKGGRIRTASRKWLQEHLSAGDCIIRGEDFSIFDETTRNAFLRCAALRCDYDLEQCNRGVTFVIFN